MNIEQTSQLIQLILNAVLMVTACVIVLGALLVRHVAMGEWFRLVIREYLELMANSEGLRGDRPLYLKHQLQQLRQHYRIAHNAILVLYYALSVLIVSTFALVLRTLLDWNWLIQLSLALFVIGIAVLLLSVGLALLDFQTSKYLPWGEVSSILASVTGGDTETKFPPDQHQVQSPKVKNATRLVEPRSPRSNSG
jgi:Protein of unknown function (DUF2721)